MLEPTRTTPEDSRGQAGCLNATLGCLAVEAGYDSGYYVAPATLAQQAALVLAFACGPVIVPSPPKPALFPSQSAKLHAGSALIW